MGLDGEVSLSHNGYKYLGNLRIAAARGQR